MVTKLTDAYIWVTQPQYANLMEMRDSVLKTDGACRWPLKIGPKKLEGKMEFGAKTIEFCKDW